MTINQISIKTIHSAQSSVHIQSPQNHHFMRKIQNFSVEDMNKNTAQNSPKHPLSDFPKFSLLQLTWQLRKSFFRVKILKCFRTLSRWGGVPSGSPPPGIPARSMSLDLHCSNCTINLHSDIPCVTLQNKQEAQLKQGLADRTAKTAVSAAI